MVFAHLNLLRKIVGIIGNFIALCLFLSPTPTFVRIVKKKSVEEYSPIPYLATLINCLVWVLYGLPTVHPDSTLVITINGTGILIEIVFLTIFFVYCGRQKQRLIISAVIAAETAFIAILAVLVLTLQHTTEKRTMSVGIVCCVFNVMMYASPLSVMEPNTTSLTILIFLLLSLNENIKKMVIKTKSVEFMPFWLSVAGFLNAGVWTFYALMPFDPFMAIPNGIGCLFGLAQLILYGAYYKSTKRIMAERENQPGYVGLSSAIARTGSEKTANTNQELNNV